MEDSLLARCCPKYLHGPDAAATLNYARRNKCIVKAAKRLAVGRAPNPLLKEPLRRFHIDSPAGILALDVVRVEAGLILIEADYTSVRHAVIPEQAYSPFEIGLGRLVSFDKATDYVGRRALEREQASGGSPRRLVGLEVGWAGIERLHEARGLTPAVPAAAWREARPVYVGRRRVGRATSGAWSPILKANIALASLDAADAEPGTRVDVEWTVEARRGRAEARVVELPFLDLPRKRA